MPAKLNIGYAGLHFSNFEAEKHSVFEESVKGLGDLAGDLGFNLISWPGLIGSGEEASAASGFFRENGVDFLILQSSSLIMGDVIPPFSGGGFRLGFWMVPEPLGSEEIQLNSMTGFNLGVSILKKAAPESKIKWFYGSPDGEDFRKRLKITVRALTVLKNMDGSRIAVADEAVPGFINLTYSGSMLKQMLGLEIVKLPLGRLFSAMKKTGAEASVIKKSMIDDSRIVEVDGNEIDSSAAAAAALKSFAAEGGFQAAALKCWPEFQSEFYMAPCLAVSWLNDNGLPTSCEGDVPGAVSMLAAWYLSGDAPTMNDPVAIDPDRGLVQMWHCGPGPASWADDSGRTISYHHTLNRRNENDREYGLSSDIRFRSGPVTMFRISGDGKEIFIIEGDVVPGPSKPFAGSGGWIGNLRSGGRGCSPLGLLQAAADYGIDHHYPVMRGHYERELREFAAWCGMTVRELPEVHDYLV